MSEKIGVAEVDYSKCGSLKLYSKLFEAEKYFTKPKYVGIVTEARKVFQAGDFEACKKKLDELPNSGELLERLVSKLKNKHLYKTLRKIEDGTLDPILDSIPVAKGLSSLLTHILIECEHGNDEYKILLLNVAEKLNEIIYGTLR